jgi:hypothetical protein
MTSHFTLGSNEFLEYNVDYSVLICRECEYAIQKSAVSLVFLTCERWWTEDG